MTTFFHDLAYIHRLLREFGFQYHLSKPPHLCYIWTERRTFLFSFNQELAT